MFTILRSEVTDQSGKVCPRVIDVEFDEQGPYCVRHDDRAYTFTGKTGVHRASGLPTREMSTEEDARLWISLDGKKIWED